MSYLNQYQRLYDKAEEGELNTAELMLLNNLDPGELRQFEQARELSHKLLTDWLSEYKFKDWKDKATGKAVTKQKKRKRAEEIAKILSDNEKWLSHGRMITRDTLTSKSENIRLRIEKIEDDNDFSAALDDYVRLLEDYMQREERNLFVHTREYF